MNDYGTITIYTQVYNTKPYLEQCVDSVLSQTYSNIEYILIDNGCTDGSSEILRRFAERDSRIKLVRFEENQQGFWRTLLDRYATGRYFAYIDSDDWWEPDCLERLLILAEENRLDIVCTGCVMHHMASGRQSLRRVEKALFLTEEQFPKALPVYHQFFRTTWGKLIRMDVFQSVPRDAVPTMPYGGDTAHSFQLLRRSSRIGIDASAFYHYRIHSRSVSHQYDPRRFETDVYLYNDAIDFLAGYGPISAENRSFLQCVYANAVIDTTGVIQNAALAPWDKLRVYRMIAEHPITLAAYRECADESAERSRSNLLIRALEAGAALGKRDDTDLRAVTQNLLPGCGQAISGANAELFLEDRQLLPGLLQDDADSVLEVLLERMRSGQGVKKYAVPETIRALAVSDPLLCQIDDAVFLRRYGGIYRKVWKGEYLNALDDMAGLLASDGAGGGRETFLNLFVSLAALEEQVPAFIFGKLQLAWLYLRQNRPAECQAVTDELAEMGLESEELFKLRQELEEKL